MVGVERHLSASVFFCQDLTYSSDSSSTKTTRMVRILMFVRILSLVRLLRVSRLVRFFNEVEKVSKLQALHLKSYISNRSLKGSSVYCFIM